MRKNTTQENQYPPQRRNLCFHLFSVSGLVATMDEELSERLRIEAAEYVTARRSHGANQHNSMSIARALLRGDLAEIGGDLTAERLPELRDRVVRALRRERGKARSGSPAYSFNRHMALHQLLKALPCVGQIVLAGGKTCSVQR